MKNKVHFRKPLLYKFLYALTFLAHRIYYRRITVVGFEKIPENTPVIFAPNHQNALMDPLAAAFAAHRRLVFLARADIFKKPSIAKILNMLQILPIYRIRDGIESLGLNQEVFKNTVNVLKANIPICILPEGNHEGQKRLRPLKKGIFRIAFQAEESLDYKLNLHIVPVGVDYSDYFNAGSDLIVVFGTPIRIADYAEQYRENEQKTINTLMNLLAESMRSVMIHIPEENYGLTTNIIEMYEPNVWDTHNVKRLPYNKLTIKQYLAHKTTEALTQHPEKAAELGATMGEYNKKLKDFAIDDCLLQQKSPRFLSLIFESLLSIFVLPLYLYGLILNFIPLKVPVWIASKIKDRHFQSSIHFGISMFLFPIYYLLVISLFCLFTDGYLPKLIFALTLPLTGYFAFYNDKHLRSLWSKLRFFVLRHTRTEQMNALQSERNHIIELIKATLNS